MPLSQKCRLDRTQKRQTVALHWHSYYGYLVIVNTKIAGKQHRHSIHVVQNALKSNGSDYCSETQPTVLSNDVSVAIAGEKFIGKWFKCRLDLMKFHVPLLSTCWMAVKFLSFSINRSVCKSNWLSKARDKMHGPGDISTNGADFSRNLPIKWAICWAASSLAT